MKSLTPFGVQDWVPTEAKRVDKAIRILSNIFEAENYERLRTPTLEYVDSLAPGLGHTLRQSAVTFLDKANHLLMLRPDHTAPIARIVATRMQNDPLPLRLYYTDNVFRSHEQDPNELETFQAGLELIGESSAERDVEAISLCIEGMKAMGFADFSIDIGHIDFLKDLSDRERTHLLSGNYDLLGHIPERGGKDLIHWHKGLSERHEILEAKGYAPYINYNKGLVKEISYYTGLIFECNVPEGRQVIASGGRYDNLLSAFGYDQPAVGFAFNINALEGLIDT